MFTGIVEQLCTITSVVPLDSSKGGGSGYTLTISSAHSILGDCNIGDSIAVNGTCLTVTTFSSDEGWFKIGVAPETLKKTNLGELKVGDRVNCERAMGAKTRFGGHFVQGHVDTTAVLRSVIPTGNALTLTLRLNYAPGTLPLPSELSPYLIPKGYVTLDGASLTLIDVSPPQGGAINQEQEEKEGEGEEQKRSETVEFSVMLIAHTQEVIGLSRKKAGETVNVELDMVGKYVHRAVVGAASTAPSSSESDSEAAAGAGAPSSRAVDAAAGQASSPSDALTAYIERVVRRVLAEGTTK